MRQRFNNIKLDFEISAPTFTIITLGVILFEICKPIFFSEYYVPERTAFDKLPVYIQWAQISWVIWVLYALNLPNVGSVFFICAFSFVDDALFRDTTGALIFSSIVYVFFLFRTLATNISFLKERERTQTSFQEKLEEIIAKKENSEEDKKDDNTPPIEFS